MRPKPSRPTPTHWMLLLFGMHLGGVMPGMAWACDGPPQVVVDYLRGLSLVAFGPALQCEALRHIVALDPTAGEIEAISAHLSTCVTTATPKKISLVSPAKIEAYDLSLVDWGTLAANIAEMQPQAEAACTEYLASVSNRCPASAPFDTWYLTAHRGLCTTVGVAALPPWRKQQTEVRDALSGPESFRQLTEILAHPSYGLLRESHGIRSLIAFEYLALAYRLRDINLIYTEYLARHRQLRREHAEIEAVHTAIGYLRLRQLIH